MSIARRSVCGNLGVHFNLSLKPLRALPFYNQPTRQFFRPSESERMAAQYAKDQPQGYKNHVEKVAIVGVSTGFPARDSV